MFSKNILSLLLIITIIFTPFTVFADDSSGAEQVFSFERLERKPFDPSQNVSNLDSLGVIEKELPENRTTVIEGKNTGLVMPSVTVLLDEDPTRSITKTTKPIHQYRGADIYGNTLGDEFFLYRSQLSSIEKKAYDQLYNDMAQVKESTEMAVAIPSSELFKIYTAIYYDRPELIWSAGTCTIYSNNQGITTKVVHMYNDLKNDVSQNYANTYGGAVGIALAAAKLPTKAEQVKYVNDHLVNITTYQLNAPHNQIAYSLLVRARTVCAGYAKTFLYCMQLLGIPAAYVVGYAGELHAWNIVKLDNDWYNIDVTWNDPYQSAAGEYDYRYFNITDAQISKDHQRVDTSIQLPAANGTKYSYNNFFRGNAYGSDFSLFTPYSGYVEFLGTHVVNNTHYPALFDSSQSSGSGNTAANNTNANNTNANNNTVSNNTNTQTNNSNNTDDFDWDSYYNEYDNNQNNTQTNTTQGFLDESTGIYYHYDSVNSVYYYLASDGYYYGFRNDGSNQWYVWYGNGWQRY